VKENRTPHAWHRRVRIVVGDENQVVEPVFPPHLLMGGRIGPGDIAVIGGIVRVVAPAAFLRQRCHRKGAVRRFDTVGSEEAVGDAPGSDRGCPIAFTFILGGYQAASAHGTGKGSTVGGLERGAVADQLVHDLLLRQGLVTGKGFHHRIGEVLRRDGVDISA